MTIHRIAENTAAPTDRLSARPKSLVADGILERRPLPDDPRHDGYYLTAAGRDLLGVIREPLRRGDRRLTTEPPMRLRHHEHDSALRRVRDHRGGTVDPQRHPPRGRRRGLDPPGPRRRLATASRAVKGWWW
ncbi:helix-turn-helix domain-containing protein [Kitasatospora sp. SolWspMP-SS2h]|uniref:winged helix-turn-helix transcriptional regulator n=1 Tax=Kitasatospora sp. SolWspMP-SS2h TaxID=1305729 RepID=UPI001313FFE1|nr:winged helix-turn-helix transcriptional regulator [Kitasatospora sp. SolWspMP-SS2h]